jgi:hypothetical protein
VDCDRGRDESEIVAPPRRWIDDAAIMRFPWVLAAVMAAGACATGASSDDDDDTPDARVDASRVDGPTAIDAPAIDAPEIDAATIDAATIDAAVAIDASTDGATPIDAAVPVDAAIDAPGCTPTTQQLLANANLDGTPLGTGWTETRIDPAAALITADTPGLAAHTTPNRIWLGGIAGDIFEDAEDALEQTVTIPANTTALVLRGQYGVLTSETGTTVYDDARVELLSTGGAVLETVQTLSNAGPTTTWVALTFNFATPRAGQTVRLRFRSANDFSNETSFFWDSLALEATLACP